MHRKPVWQRGLFITFLVFLSFQGYTQKKQWIKKYPLNIGNSYGDGFSFVKEDYDKGFFIANQGVNGSFGIRVYKTDVNGNIMWERFVLSHLDPTLYGAACTADGGLVLEGAIGKTDSTNDNYLLKINACGQVEWTRIYDLNQYSLGGPIAVLSNGDIAVSSYVAIAKDTIYNYYNCWTFLTDSKGNIKWQVFNNLNPWQLLIDNNENILTTGSCYLPYFKQPNIGVVECGLVKMDTSGKRLWYAEYDVEKNIAADGVNSAQTSDNGYITLAEQRNENRVMLIKFNSDGAAQWIKLIGDTQQYEFCWGISNANNGAYLVAAGTNIINQFDVYKSDVKLLKINEQGQVLKQVIFPDTGEHEWIFYGIGVTSDHKYTLISTGNYGGSLDSLMVLKYNENLELDTFYTHDTNKYDYLCNHKITFDSTIFLNTSNPLPVTVPFPTDTETIVNPGRFAIYPNPSLSNNIIHVICPAANTPTTIAIYDVSGRLVGKYSFTSSNFGQAHLAPCILAFGCYILVLEQKGKRYMQKLMVE